MKRLINDMSAEEISKEFAFSPKWAFDVLTRLCEPIPEWHDTIDPEDMQTWVLCYVSDYTECYEKIAWVYRYNELDDYKFKVCVFPGSQETYFKYANVLDLNIRCTK
jgi:hypothetical protein